MILRSTILLLCLLVPIPALQAAWQSLEVPSSEEDYYLIGSRNIHDLWLTTTSGNIYHGFGKNWKKISPPTGHVNSILHYSQADSTLLATAISRHSLKTSFFIYRQDAWESFSYENPIPARTIISDQQHNFWCYGDWGTLLHLQNGHIQVIENPIKHHINTAMCNNPDSLWLGTRNEGVYLLTADGNFQSFFDSSWVNHDVLYLFNATSDGITCLLEDGQIFRIASGTITPRSTFQAPRPFITALQAPEDSLLYAISDRRELYYLSPSGWQYLPIFPPHPINSLMHCKGTGLLLSGNHGLLLKRQHQTDSYFHNMADILSVEGSSIGNTRGAALVDLNHDHNLDLFVFNTDRYQPSRLYQNHNGVLFSEISFEAGLLNIRRPQVFTFGDFDQEGSADLAYAELAGNRYNLTIQYQITGMPLLKHSRHISGSGIDSNPVQLLLCDPDLDQDPDILFVSRKSQGNHPGTIAWIENIWGHDMQEQPASDLPFSRSWYTNLVEISDYPQDPSTFYACKSWTRDEILQIQPAGTSVMLYDSLFRDTLKLSTYGIALGDYDNDGDMDLFRTSGDFGLQIFENDGHQYLERTHEILGPNDTLAPFVNHVNLADFNNDGFLDMFLTPHHSQYSNTLLYNQAGRSFEKLSANSGLALPPVSGSCLGDLEGDGDIDLFGFRTGTNLLWINDHDRHDFILINQTGSSGYHPNNSAYALFYQAGHIGEPDALLGRRQSRASNSHPLAFNSSAIHFGMGQFQAVDIILYTAYGQRIEYQNVAAGTVLDLPDYVGVQALTATFGHFFKQILNTPRIAVGLISLILNLIGQLYFSRFVRKRFLWPDAIIYAVGSVNLIIYFIFFYVSDFGNIWVTFVLPLSTAQSVNLGSLLLQYIYIRLTTQFSSIATNNDLLQKIMIFAHGKWALKNINSLILFFQNYESASKSKLGERITERVDTFLNLTLPAIRELLHQIPKSSENSSVIREIHAKLEFVEGTCQTYRQQHTDWTGDAGLLANRLSAMLNMIRQLKQNIYANFSSSPMHIIRQLLHSIEEEIHTQAITVDLLFEIPDKQMTLITTNDLLAVLDNCIHNAIRAMENQPRKILRIKVYEFAPRIRIAISDTGSGISPKLADKVFEAGFSASGSSGLGLFQARQILEKYAATITLQQPLEQGLTTFIIDLQKGVPHDQA